MKPSWNLANEILENYSVKSGSEMLTYRNLKSESQTILGMYEKSHLAAVYPKTFCKK